MHSREIDTNSKEKEVLRRVTIPTKLTKGGNLVPIEQYEAVRLVCVEVNQPVGVAVDGSAPEENQNCAL